MNRQTFFLLLLGTTAIVLTWAAFAVLSGGSSQKRVRMRVRAATGLDQQTGPISAPNIRIASPDELPLRERLVRALGYNAELPSGFAASVPLVIAISTVAALLAYWRTREFIGDLGGIAVGLGGATAAMRFLFRRKTKKYTRILFNQIPDTISLILRAVRAGLPVGEAMRNISQQVPRPTRDEFARVAGEMALGIPIDAAVWHLYARTQIREYAFFAVTLGLQGQTGGNLGETLQNLSDMVRRRVSMEAKARALAAEARTSASILAGLPFLTAGAILLGDPGYISILFTDKRGPGFLVAFAVLLAIGMSTIHWLIQRATQD